MINLPKVDDRDGSFVMELVEIIHDARGLMVAPLPEDKKRWGITGCLGVRFVHDGSLETARTLPFHMIDQLEDVLKRWRESCDGLVREEWITLSPAMFA